MSTATQRILSLRPTHGIVLGTLRELRAMRSMSLDDAVEAIWTSQVPYVWRQASLDQRLELATAGDIALVLSLRAAQWRRGCPVCHGTPASCDYPQEVD